jgi:hypothetical protein
MQLACPRLVKEESQLLILGFFVIMFSIDSVSLIELHSSQLAGTQHGANEPLIVTYLSKKDFVTKYHPAVHFYE